MAAGPSTANMSMNGASAPVVDAKSLQQFYHNLFRLQDDVFAGKHPSIKLPDELMALIAQVKQQPAVYTTSAANGVPNGNQAASVALAGALLPGLGPQPVAPGPAHSQRPVSTGSNQPGSSTSSAFDPILLTKSNELVAAELAMRRQRIEQQLADKVAASKPAFNARGKDFAPDYDTSLDVDAVWARAKIVISHEPAWSIRSESESFDENDYYSSQAMSWSTEQTDADRQEAAKTGSSFVIDPAPVSSRPAQQTLMQDRAQTAQQVPLPAEYDDLPDEDDEDDYSPPPPDALPGTTDSDTPPNQQMPAQANVSRPVQAYDSRYEYNRPRPQQAAKEPHFIHSHIREPFMPQPSRVSPLALGKVPTFEQTQIPPTSAVPPPQPPHHQAGESSSEFANNGTPRERSPAEPKETMKQTKKRKRKAEREAAREEKRSKKEAAKRAEERQQRQAASPVPYIKPEPTSPPPFAQFADMPPPPKRRVIEYPHDDVQVISPYEPRVRQSAGYPDHADAPPPPRAPPGYRWEAPPEGFRYAEPISPQHARVYSPAPARQARRDDQDLRRFASLQYASRPYSPAAAYPYERAPSTAVPQRRAVSYYDREPVMIVSPRDAAFRQPSAAPSHYVRDRSRSPVYDGRTSAYPAMRSDGIERIASPVMMPPPPVPMRIVEDSDGRKYYATPAPPDAVPEMRVRESVAPPSRYYDDYPPPSHQLYERPSTRASMIPPPSRPVYEDEMPPSPMPVPQQRGRREADPAVEAYRSYRQRETSMRPPETRGRPALRASDDMPPPPAPRERPQMPEVPEGRRIVSYDDSHSSPRQPLVPKDSMPAPAYATMPCAYSVRPDAGRPAPDMYEDAMGPPRGREIPRFGTGQPVAPPEHLVQMPWERSGNGRGGERHGYEPNFPSAAGRDGRWVEVDEGHGGGRRVRPGGEVDEGYGGGKRVIYHL